MAAGLLAAPPAPAAPPEPLAGAGTPAAEQPSGLAWAAVYKADVLRGDRPRFTSGVGNLSLSIDVDAGLQFGWDGVSLHTELLWNHGGKPNQRLGTVQGISNIEVADNAARLYSAWIERHFASSDTRVLAGLYDVNSEFYVTDASSMLIHPSFGIGIDFAQSGRNGPSIFPNLGLGLRVRQSIGGGGHYGQFAVIDGVPGDPDHPGRTVIRVGADDGALLVGEFGWQGGAPGAQNAARWGLGAWRYTRRSERLDGGPAAHNQGAYVLTQAVLIDREEGRTIGFVRAGVANRYVNRVDRALVAGMLVERPFGERGPSALTAGVAVARFGRAARLAQAVPGVDDAAHETALELGVGWQLWQGLALQPLLQRVWHPGGRVGSPATIAGLRLQWTLSAR